MLENLSEDERYELRIGPLSSRGVEALSGGPPCGSLGLIMGKLTDRCELERCFDLDMLTVVLTDRRPPAEPPARRLGRRADEQH